MTKMVAKLLDDNIDMTNLFLAGSVLGRLGVVEDVKGVAVFLLGGTSGYMTGADMRLDGGATTSV